MRTYNSERKLVDQVGITDEGFLQPFNVNEQEALEIARAHGFLGEGEPRGETPFHVSP
jgi:hypothetical protein